MNRLTTLLAALVAPLLLASCLFVPGKFESKLVVHADRSFTFTYKGEVVAVDLGNGMGDALKGLGDEDNTTQPTAIAYAVQDKPADKAADQAKKDAEYRDLAAKLAKEAGYRSVEYRGDGVFLVDYALSGTLTHNFTYPFNADASMIFPFVTVELRGKDRVNIKAPAFAKENDASGLGQGMSDEASARLDGTFTLVTDAELVSQNNEDGARTEGKNRTMVWKATPTTRTAPSATLRLAPLP